MEKIQLTGTGGSPHASDVGVTFQAGEGDTLEFTPIPSGARDYIVRGYI